MEAALVDEVRAAVGDAAYDERLAQHALDLAELNRVEQTTLPIFYMYPGCGVGEVVRLHLFEPRYKILIRRAWEGNRRFVYCAGRPHAGTPGVLVRVERAVFLSDGRANIEGRGIEAIELGETWVEDATGGLVFTKVPTVASPEALFGRSDAARAADEHQGTASPAPNSLTHCCLVM